MISNYKAGKKKSLPIERQYQSISLEELREIT
jgi:hypothetical protein